jgi:phytoene/squalene synthetase
VTDALHYFIGHRQPSPQNGARYLAATGAHITHMLRDTLEDIEAGYFNIPREYLAANGIGPQDVESDAYRTWVKERAKLARAYFKSGNDYLAQVENMRCRIAGYAYVARFEVVLDAIERLDYRLASGQPQRRALDVGMRMSGPVLSSLAGWAISVLS